MNKETLKHFIEYKYKHKDIIIDDFWLSQSKWEVQVLWRPKTSPYFGDDTCVSICETQDYDDWYETYIRTKKIKEICSKLVI
jgi:hypothetical protein